jgi:hypothetical protein
MLNETINNEPVCVCVFITKEKYCLFVNVMWEYIISYKNQLHIWNLLVAHRLQNTAVSFIKHILIIPNRITGIPNLLRMFYSTSFLNES